MPGLNGKTVLHIEDEADTRVLLKNIIETAGLIYCEASTTQDGLTVAHVKNPHLILLDLQMEGTDGFEFLEKIKALPHIKQTPIIVLSGSNDRTSVRKAISLGAKDYLLKPFNSIVLMQKIRKIFHHQSFRKVLFPSSGMPSIQITLPAQIKSVNETGLCIEAAVRMAPETRIQLKSDFLKKIENTKSPLRTGDIGVYTAEGQFQSRVDIFGVTRESLKEIKDFLNAGLK